MRKKEREEEGKKKNVGIVHIIFFAGLTYPVYALAH